MQFSSNSTTLNEKLSNIQTAFAINGFAHIMHSNNVPVSYLFLQNLSEVKQHLPGP